MTLPDGVTPVDAATLVVALATFGVAGITLLRTLRRPVSPSDAAPRGRFAAAHDPRSTRSSKRAALPSESALGLVPR
jgi:hypothetical protein